MTAKANNAVSISNSEIQVTGRHVEVTQGMKDHALDKMSKLDRFSLRIADASITMDVTPEGHRVDVSMKVNNVRLKAHAITDDMYASIDMVMERVQKQLRRYKRRLVDHHAKGVSEVSMMVDVIRRPSDEDELNDEIEEANLQEEQRTYEPPHVVKNESRPLKTLTVDEAMMKMELTGDHFLVYRSEEDQKLCVIYRREDGDYGVIRAEAQ